jgi:hypothetical protein
MGFHRFFHFPTMTENGVINSISIYHNGGPGDLLLAVYSDYEGAPASRLAATDVRAVNAAAGWQTIELTETLPVEEGQKIWLALVFENNPGVRRTSGSPGNSVSSGLWYVQMPGEFGESTPSSYIYSICANYTAEGGLQELELKGNP